MQKTQLILIEGISGSGKSTLAQFLAHVLTRSGIACRWWYEEEKGHPLYVFHDRASLQHTIDDLSAGRYQEVIDAAMEKWKQLAQDLQSSESVMILDGCLFGYLTWFGIRVNDLKSIGASWHGSTVTYQQQQASILESFLPILSVFRARCLGVRQPCEMEKRLLQRVRGKRYQFF